MPSMKGSDVTTVMEDSGQGIWFGGPFLEVFQLKDGEVRNFEKDKLYGGTPVVVMVEDAEKTLWAGSAAGLWQVGSNSLMRPQGLDGSAFGSIHCLITNQEGGIWLGTEGNGLFLLERRRFSSLGKDNGLANSDSWSISQAPDGSVWIGTKGGLSHLAKGRFENFGTLEGFESLNVHSVVVDSRGRVWAGTQVEHGTGWGALHRFQDKRFPSLETTIGFKSGDVHSLCPAQDGTLWIVASGAVSKWEGEKIRTLERRQVSGLSAFVDRKENLWIGLGGLTRLKGTDITYFGSKEGLSPSQYAAVHEDENGALWVLSSDKGIIRYKDGTFKSITTQHGLLSDLNLSLVEDDQGRYWFNCYNGIYWVRKQELNEVADGKRQAISCVAYGLEDGLPSLEGNGGNTPNGRKTRDGLLWFPTTKGVAIIDPSRTMRDDQPLSIIIEQVRADGEVMYKDVGEPEKQEVVRTSQQHSGRKWETTASLNSELRLSAGSGHSVVVNYAAPNFFTAEKTRYRFRLEGRDPKWMEAQSQHFAQLEGLQPGHYVFHVTACNRHGVWNPVGAQFAFYIPALFYQTWPFYTVCAGLLISAGTGIQAYRLSVQRRILGFERAAALAEERERIARDMHDDLGASLTRIAQLSERAKGETGDESRSSIDKISTAAGELVDSVGELVWATNSKYDDLESMVAYFREYTAQYSDGAGIECHIDFPEVVPSTSVSADFRRQLFLVLKEALHNVTKHAEAKDVWVRLEISGEQLRLEVRDNGKGMECKKSPAFHHGLSNMRERVRSLGGKFQIQSELGKGTVVGVEVPFPARMKEKGGAKKS